MTTQERIELLEDIIDKIEKFLQHSEACGIFKAQQVLIEFQAQLIDAYKEMLTNSESG